MRRKYIKKNKHKCLYHNIIKHKAALLAVFILMCFVISRYTLIPHIEYKLNYIPEKSSYSGVIDFWDTSSTTIKGNKYSVIRTICSEYSERYNSLIINFTSLSERSATEEIILNAQRGNIPDVMRLKTGDYAANENLALSSAELSEKIIMQYEEYIQRSVPYSDKLIIDMYYDISLILINRDAAKTLGVSYDKNLNISKDDFISLLEKLSANNTLEEYNIIDFPIEDIYSYLPFCLSSDGSYSTDYLSLVSRYLPKEHDIRSKEDSLNDFLSGKTVIYCADLDTLNTLIRRQNQNRGFAFDYCLYPHDGEKMIFVNSITSYIFNKSSDENKNKVLADFALYMLSDDALKYTENLGKINCTKSVFTYETYLHLKDFKDKDAIYFTYRDPEMKAIYSRLSSFYK